MAYRSKITASQLERVFACSGSQVLPTSPQEESTYAAFGTAGHEYLEDCSRMNPWDALDLMEHEEAKATCESIDLQDLPFRLAEIRAEVPYAYSPITQQARVLEPTKEYQGRNIYKLMRADEIGGTADVIGHDFVADYKFGHDPTVPEYSEQMKFLALCLARENRLTEVTAHIVHILKEDGSINVYSHTFDIFDFAEMDMRLLKMQESVDDAAELVQLGKPAPVEIGEHCHYCRTKNACPAQAAIAVHVNETTVIPVMRDRVEGQLQRLDQGLRITDATAMLAWVKAARFRASEVEARLRGEVREHGSVPSPEGNYVMKRTRGQDRIDADIGYRALCEEVDKDVADAVVPRKITKKAIKEAAKLAGLNQADTERKVLERVKLDGGLSKTKGQEKLVKESV